MLVSSLYVANLASFLTVENLTNYVLSMNDVKERKLTVCCMRALSVEVEKQWPNVTVHFIDHVGLTSYLEKSIEKVENGHCDLLALEEIHLDRAKREFCEKGFVSTNAIALSIDWHLPIYSRYQALFSEAITELKNENIDFSDILYTYSNNTSCKIQKTSRSTGPREQKQINVLQMSFPCLLLSVCMVVGTLSKLIVYRKEIFKKCAKSKNRKHKNIDKDSLDASGNREHILPVKKIHQTNDLTSTFKDEIAVFKNDEESLDALELKYRVQLISLNVQRLEENITQYMVEKHVAQLNDTDSDNQKIM